MSAAEFSPAPEDLTRLSDEELIQRHCAVPQVREPAAELWRRYEKTVRTVLNQAVFGGNLCPEGWDRTTFRDASLSRAYLKYLASICRAQIRRSRQGWFKLLASSSAIDEWRFITHRRGEEQGSESEKSSTGQPGRQEVQEDPRDLADLQFRSEYLPEYWWMRPSLPGADILVRMRERCEGARVRALIVRELLVRHAAVSEGGFDSAHMIRLRHWMNWTLGRIGAHRFGVPSSNREKNTQEVNVRRKLLGDYEELHALLKTDFGVDALKDL